MDYYITSYNLTSGDVVVVWFDRKPSTHGTYVALNEGQVIKAVFNPFYEGHKWEFRKKE